MTSKPFEPILKKLSLDRLEQVHFNDARYDSLTYRAQLKTVSFVLYIKQNLPYLVFTHLLSSLEKQMNCSIELKINVEDQNLDPKELTHYVNRCIKHYDLKRLNSHNLWIIEESKLVFLWDKDVEEAVLNECQTLQTHLNHYGYSLVVDARKKLDQEISLDTTVKPRIEESSFNQITIKNRRLKLDDYEAIDLKSCTVGMKQIKVRGRLFAIEDQWVKNNTVLRKTFYLEDGTDTISFFKFIDQEDEVQKFSNLSERDCIEVFGDVTMDNYGKELSLAVREVRQIPDWRIRTDESDLKRIEFHLHTNMSEMDGISPIEAYIKQAFEWGHEGVVITDHNTVQAYPKAQKQIESLLKKYPERSFKMGYGCEFYVSDEKLEIVRNPKPIPLKEATYVVFDLETTGLSSMDDRIIEFGAVKVIEGMTVERMQMFVNPKQTLTSFITEKTNITQAMVDQALTEDLLIGQWMSFIGDSVLVAHNAGFDVGFLNQCLLRNGYEPLKNSVIDTLDFGRALINDRRSYRLGALSKHYKINYDDTVAHRADYDAEVLVGVFQKMLNSSELSHYKTLDQLNDLNTPDSYKKLIKRHVNVIAKNEQGLKAIFRLVSLAHTSRLVGSLKDEGNSEPRLLRSDITKERDHLLVGSSCFNGEIFDAAATKTVEELKKLMAFYDFIEVQPLENYRPLIENNSVRDQDRLKTILQRIMDAALELKKPLIATGDAHYLNPEDKIFRDVYIQAKGVGAGRHPLYLYDSNKRKTVTAPDQHFRTTEEMLEAFSFLDPKLAQHMVIHAPRALFNQIDSIKPVKKDLYTPKIEGADDKLKETVYQHAYERYGNPLPNLIEERLTKELNSITTHGFGVIYYIAHLLVQKSLDDGYMVGSRGSVGSSLVASFANITEVNPLPPHYVCPSCHHSEFFLDGSVDSGFDLKDKECPKCKTLMNVDGHDIPFETFLGFEGDKVPDIDLNFSGDYQDKAHAFTKVLFGDEHVFRAGTISTVAQRTAYGYIKGYLEELGQENTLRSSTMYYLAKGCEGVKRTTGQHPGGIIVIPQDNDVNDFTPVQYPANKSNAEWLTTHFEFADIHDNVLKLDILGHVDPTAMKMLERLSGMDVRSIRMNDRTAIDVFSSPKDLAIQNPEYKEKTGAAGLPEFGTSFVRQILDSTRPRNFSDLVRVSGLSHGTDVWLNNAKDLIQGGYPFTDVIGCRDDIMIYLIHKGLPAKSAFDIMESVRKGKGLKDEWKKLMAEHDVPEWYIQSCLKIKYMFPKAHAVAYVLMAVRVAWFKVHKPLMYYATFFTLRSTSNEYETIRLGLPSIYERLKNIQSRLNDPKLKSTVSSKEEELIQALEVAYEMTSRGFGFSELDLNASQATEYILDPNQTLNLIPPFSILDGLGENVAKSIVDARLNGPFLSKEDLQARTLINTTQLKKFEQLGLLAHLDDQNQMALF